MKAEVIQQAEKSARSTKPSTPYAVDLRPAVAFARFQACIRFVVQTAAGHDPDFEIISQSTVEVGQQLAGGGFIRQEVAIDEPELQRLNPVSAPAP